MPCFCKKIWAESDETVVEPEFGDVFDQILLEMAKSS